MLTEKKEVKVPPYTIEVMKTNKYGFAVIKPNEVLMPVRVDEMQMVLNARLTDFSALEITRCVNALHELGAIGISKALSDVFEYMTILQVSPDHDCIFAENVSRLLILKDALDQLEGLR